MSKEGTNQEAPKRGSEANCDLDSFPWGADGEWALGGWVLRRKGLRAHRRPQEGGVLLSARRATRASLSRGNRRMNSEFCLDCGRISYSSESLG